ncbi:aryl-alcohol dehydrogenase-like predicted oxidoreductase [Streptomyces sp. 840.1]|uniref:aldo/keto reductase n=1 Tax=Streptomyces sp. 840.1 TaxID=2485152 RepID=UPI000F462021|nr:aldo/keto reductase [Streptomyces sp. 840.1]ROQ67051.1 aryl-alcohol dehydrogenase-like predicted oxidoreductase [Streptomyces sp. 840.1]
MTLDAYYTLGRSGLRVSPLALGTMTFGQPDWGSDARTSGEILDAYLDAGGNFVDTADIYSQGAGEELVGKLLAERGVRDRTVLSTKFTLGGREGDPNAGGNGRKAMLRSLEGSLRRLGTEYVDLYIVHAWDALTPAEEVMRGLDDLVSSGKVRYVALSDVPAWYAARAQTLAEWRGYEPLVALQLEYSLAERGLEYEFPSLAQELGMGLMTWGPLAKGLLSGKYSADASTAADLPEGRLKVAVSTGTMADNRSERNWRIVTELGKVAQEIGRSPAQVALNWVANRPAVGSVILGASKAAQIRSNLDALDFSLPGELRARLDEVSAPPRAVPYAFVDSLQARLNGQVWNKRPGYYTH